MAVESYRKPPGRFSNNGTAIRQDLPGDHPGKLLRELYNKKMSRENNRSVSVDAIPFFFFQRLKSGRRCSCFEIASSPNADCPICFQTGVVGGYAKWGAQTVVIDSTYPDLRLVNVDLLWDARPVIFRLKEDALKGHVEFVIDLLGNTGKLDLFQVFALAKRGSSIQAFIKTSEDLFYVPLNKTEIENRLNQDRIWIKLTLLRDDFEKAPPQLSHFFLRYLLREDPLVMGDTPRETQSIILSEFGIKENFSTIGIYFDDIIPRIDNEDFVATPENRRYKIIEVQNFIQGGINTAWDVQARWINDYEPFMKVPL